MVLNPSQLHYSFEDSGYLGMIHKADLTQDCCEDKVRTRLATIMKEKYVYRFNEHRAKSLTKDLEHIPMNCCSLFYPDSSFPYENMN